MRLLRRIILVVLSVIGLLLTIGVIGWFRLMAHLQGDSFRESLCDKIQASTGADEVRMEANLRIDGDTVAQRKLSILRMGAIDSIGAEHMLATIRRRALLDRKLHVRKLTMEEGHIVFRTATPPPSGSESSPSGSAPTAPTAVSVTQSPSPTVTPAEETGSDDGLSLHSIRLDFAECKDANLTLLHRDKTYSLTGSNISATPQDNGKGWTIELENGRLHSPYTYLRDTNIKTATVLTRRRSIDLTECRLMLTPGELRARAHYDSATNNWSAGLELHKAGVERLLRGDWQKRLTGEMFGKCVLKGTRHGLQTAEGHLALRNGLLEGLPFLSELTIDNTRPYRSIVLDKADCTLQYPYSAPERNLKNAWLFDKIEIISRDSTLIVRGHVIIAEDGALGGSLTIGIPRHIADRLPLPGKRISNAIFNGRGDAGYAWVNLNLSGTIDSPKEDLSVRLSTLLSSAMPELTADSAVEMLNSLFRADKAGKPDSPTEQPRQEQPVDTIINGASDLLNRGLRSLF